MSGQSTKFTLEIKGIELPQSAQEEISKALNQTLMQKIGEIDFASDSKGAGRPFTFQKILPNGGRILMMMSPALKNTIAELEKENNMPTEGSFNISGGM